MGGGGGGQPGAGRAAARQGAEGGPGAEEAVAPARHGRQRPDPI